jgi:YbbR domain-containing protein
MNLRSVVRSLVSNPVRKILAIIFAFGLWFFVALDKNYIYKKDIKVIYTNLADSLMITDSTPAINVSLIGRGGSLLSSWAAPPKARCDVIDMKLGKNGVPVTDLMIPLGFPDLRLTFNTKSIDVTIDERITRIMQVKVPTKGELKRGYSISDIVVMDTVSVTGPRNVLFNQDAVLTETLDIKNKQSSFLAKVKIKNTSDLFEFSKNQVQIEVKVDTTVKRSFTNIPLTLIFTPDQRVSSERISLDTLIVEGPAIEINNLEKKDIIVKVKLTKLTAGEHHLPATIELPQYIKPVNSVPKIFKITIY